MKPGSFIYHRPETIEEAVALKQELGSEAYFIAGGQSLVPAMNLRMARPGTLIDISDIKVLRDLSIDESGNLNIGSMVTQSRLLKEPGLDIHWPIVHAVLPEIAHEQVRNRGTVGGSLSHSDPAAEWPALSMLLNAQMHISNTEGKRVISADEFLIGIYETALDEGELLTKVVISSFSKKWRWGFHEVARRRGDFALAGAMVGLVEASDGSIEHLKIIVFGVEARPKNLEDICSFFLGAPSNAQTFKELGSLAALAIEPFSDIHADAEQRRDLVRECVVRALGDTKKQGNPGECDG